MQITETSAEGLKREFKVVIPAQDIDQAVDSKLTEIGKTIRIPGFRPGRVPLAVLRKRYSSSVLGEVLEQTVSTTSESAMTERGLRLALQPKISLTSFAPGKDLEYTMAVELLPEVEPADFSTIALDKWVADVEEKAIGEAVDNLIKSRHETAPAEDSHKAADGDTVVIDFAGSVDGKEYPGMKGDDFSLELGSNSFIDTFEKQLVGAKKGAHRKVKVTFPEDYGQKDLAGKAAVFEVDVKEVRCPAEIKADDEFAKKLGLASLEELRGKVKERVSHEYAQASRYRLKRQLLDKLAEAHTFTVPEGMVDMEFNGIWERLQQELKAGRAKEEEGKSEDTLKTEYRAIAERRVRLGLLLAEVGRRHNIQVAQEDLNRAMAEEARRFPGQERQVMEFFRGNPQAIERLRAPLFEDKVVDFIIELAKVDEKKVSAEELMKDPEEDEAV